jgi:hypothetical protein
MGSISFMWVYLNKNFVLADAAEDTTGLGQYSYQLYLLKNYFVIFRGGKKSIYFDWTILKE